MARPKSNHNMQARAVSATPLYKLTESAYINDRMLEEGDEFEANAPPGPHMIPLNDAARAMCEKHKNLMDGKDPISQLSIVGSA